MPAWHGQPQKTRYAFTVSGIASTFGGVANDPPVWQNVPHITFFVGITSTFPLSGTYQSNNYVTDANFDTIVITKNNVFVQGVTWDGGKFTSNGTGSQTTVTGHILTADDGHNSNVASSPFQIAIIPGAISWTSTPSVSFVENSATPYNLGQNILNYNSSTDEFRITPSYSLPSWLSLTAGPGTGSGNLTPSGMQVDADDIAASPGIKIDVRRSGGAWVSSSAFGVTVTAAPVVAGSIDDLAFEAHAAPMTSYWPWVDPQYPADTPQRFWTGKHTNWQFCPYDGKIYGFGGDGTYPGGPGGSSYDIRFPRLTIGATGNTTTHDIYYPYWGQPGEDYPTAPDAMTWVWDDTRKCFWSFGGGGGIYTNAKDVGVPYRAQRHISRFWVGGAQAGNWEIVVQDWQYAHPEGMAGIFLPANGTTRTHDYLVWINDSWAYYYNCNTGADGRCAVNLHPSINSAYISIQHPNVYDATADALICLVGKTPAQGRGMWIWSVPMGNFPTSIGTWTNLVDGLVGYPLESQAPMFFRGSGANRVLYVMATPYTTVQANSEFAGLGLGTYAVDFSTGTPTLLQGAHPIFDNYATQDWGPSIPVLGRTNAHGINAGVYDPIYDRFIGTSQAADTGDGTGGRTYIFRWSAPSWTPQTSGTVQAYTTTSTGSASNTFDSVMPAKVAPYGGTNTNGNPAAWMSGCYARHLSTNGVMLYQGGGDADWWGNEVYAWDWDSRNWYRLSDPCTSMSGNGFVADSALATSHANYFNMAYGEHGPVVPAGGYSNGNWGLFPVDGNGNQATQPGVPHFYGGPCWVPGSFIGNRRGAFVRAASRYIYGGSSQTYQAHYFDLDVMRWGRLSTNGGTWNGYGPTYVFDEEGGKIYHQMGYLDLSAKFQQLFTWNNFPFQEYGSEFDPVGRIWILLTSGGFIGTQVDNPAHTFSPMIVTGSNLWGNPDWGGLCYDSDDDCFFYYNQATNPQYIWRIDPPAGNRFTGTWTATRITMTGATVAAGGTTHTYNKTRYIQPLKCVSIYNGASTAYLYKP